LLPLSAQGRAAAAAADGGGGGGVGKFITMTTPQRCVVV